MGIDLQGSQYGPPIPVGYGQNKVSGNVIDYWGFKSQAHTQSVGKGGSQSSTSYTYQASYLNGLCEGPITGVVQVWSGTSVVLLSTLAPFTATGALGQAPWSQLPAGHQLGYSGTALFGVSDMALGGSATLPNYNYEIQWPSQFGSGVLDANPSAILSDLCTNAQYGLPFNYLGSLTQYSNYCVANGLFLSPVYEQQSTGVQVLTDLFRNTNTYAYFSEGQLKVVPLGDVAVTGNGVTYTPNVTPVVNLGAGDFIVSGSSAAVSVQRKAPQDNLNLIRVEFTDRSNSYHNSAVVASIDEDLIANGARSDQSVSINGCTSASVARFIAQNMVQRAYYVRNTYQFKLAWRYCYLEPTDIVTLTDVNLGLSNFPVRITAVEEDGEGLLSITAEEFPEGIGHSALYGTQSGGQTPVDPNSDPGPVNAPYLFRAPGYLVGGARPEVWCAVCGSGALWAGCDVYLSHDGTSYSYLGTIDKPARYGVTTSSFPPAPADPDTTTVLGVNLYAPAALNGGTQADADNLNTLAMVGAELIAYETATLTGTEAYNLTYLRRNAYGTTNGAGITMAAGAPFVRIDSGIFRIPVDPSSIGQTVYLKFLSLNSFGKTPRTLATETAYIYVVASSVELPDVPPTPTGFAVLAVADGIQLSWTNTVPAAVSSVAIYRSSSSTGPFSLVADVGPTTNTWTDHFTNGATWYYYLTARGPLISSGWSANTATISSTGKTVANGATVGATVGTNLLNLDGSTMPQVTAYRGAWSGVTAYVLGNETLAADGNHYIAIAPSTNQQPPNAIYWKLLGPQNQDALVDGPNYGRILGTQLQLGTTLKQGDGINIVSNGTFIDSPGFAPPTADGQGFAAGWIWGESNSPSSFVLAREVPGYGVAAGYPADAVIRLNTGVSIANGAVIFASLWGVLHIPVSPGDVYVVSAFIGQDTNAVAPAGVSITLLAGLRFYDANSNYISNLGASHSTGLGGGLASNTFSAPSNAAFAVAIAQLVIANTSGATFNTGTSLYADARFTAIQVAKQIQDQTSLPQIAVLNYRAKYAPAISYSTASGSPATATMTVGAATALIGTRSVSYGTMSVSVTGTGGSTVTYYLYFDDPAYAGGTPVLNATTNGNDCYAANGRVYAGSVSFTFPTSGTGSGSGVGGTCVTDDMWVCAGLRAGDALTGDAFDCVDFPSGQGKHVRRLRGVTRASEACVRIGTDEGASLVCSVSTPFDTPDGRTLYAPDMLGEEVLTDHGIERVTSLEHVGVRRVCRMHLGGVSYAAGEDATHRVYSHNATSKP